MNNKLDPASLRDAKQRPLSFVPITKEQHTARLNVENQAAKEARKEKEAREAQMGLQAKADRRRKRPP